MTLNINPKKSWAATERFIRKSHAIGTQNIWANNKTIILNTFSGNLKSEILGNNNIDIEAYSDIRPKLWSVSLTYKLGKKSDIEY